MSRKTPRSPRAFSVDEPSPEADRQTMREDPPVREREPRAFEDMARIEMAEEDFFEREARDETAPPPVPPRRRSKGLRLGAIALSAFGLVITLALGIWFEQLVRALFERHPVLGQVGLAAIAILALALLAAIARELIAIGRQRSVDRLREEIAAALEAGNGGDIAGATARLAAHYAHHPKTAAGRAHLAEIRTDIIDPEDRYRITEREMLTALDAEARTLVMNAAKRVSVVTAVSPRALVDIGYVLYENIRLIRVIAEHYGGRAGTFGTLTLVRRVVSHLAVTGTIAIGDGLIQQLVGHGVAARLSARLGEGVVNGLMTARIGIAAMAVSRPAPFVALPPPRMADMARTLTRYTAAQRGDTNLDGKSGVG